MRETFLKQDFECGVTFHSSVWVLLVLRQSDFYANSYPVRQLKALYKAVVTSNVSLATACYP